MALFHLQSKIHGKTTKSGGSKSITAVVAYRHCFKFDEFDYTKKSGLVDSFMLFPQEILEQTFQGEGLDIFPEDVKAELKAEMEKGDVKALWKAIEAKEKRKDAQYCQEIEVSLQHELTLEENIKNLKTLINNNFIKKGLCADVCIHNSKSGDNLHAHILITQRPLESIELNLATMEPIYKFGNKLRDQDFNKGSKIDQITPIREEWANLCNASFSNVGLDITISHKTLAEQREEALKAGDFIKAAELDREPAKYIHRSESVQAKAEREVAAEKAEYHNEKETKRYKLEMELAKDGLIPLDSVVEPVLMSVIKTFQDMLIFRKLERIRKIEENVTRYIKDRAARYSRQFRKARTRAEETITSVRSVVRNQRKKMVAEINRISNNISGRIDSKLNKVIREQSTEFRNTEQDKLKYQIEKAIRILDANKNKEKVDKILDYVAKNPDLAQKAEFAPLLKKVEEHKRMANLAKKIDRKLLWVDPYQKPTLKPSWVK